MHWVLASFLMFVSSVVLYVLVRKSALLKVPSQFNNLAMFIIPLLLYFILVIPTNTNLALNNYQLLIIVISAFLFSYLGNVFSLKSIEYAPNPGYSLILSKSYVVFTTFASILLFNSTLTLKAILAIVMIIGASGLIMIDKTDGTRGVKSSSSVQTAWLPLAFGAFFCWGMLALSSKYLLMLGVNILSRLMYSMAIVSMLILTEMKWKKVSWRSLTKQQIGVLLLIGIFGASFNYFMQEGFNSAPNIGYVNAVNASSIAGVTLVSAWLFKDELNKQKLLGVLGVTTGLILLVS